MSTSKAKEWSIRGLAIELNVDRATLTKQLTDLEPHRKTAKTHFYLLADAHRHLLHKGGAKLDASQEAAKLSKARREKIELEHKELESQLVRTDEVAALWSELTTNAKTKLRAIPSKAAPVLMTCETIGEAERLLKTLVDEALNELANEINAET